MRYGSLTTAGVTTFSLCRLPSSCLQEEEEEVTVAGQWTLQRSWGVSRLLPWRHTSPPGRTTKTQGSLSPTSTERGTSQVRPPPKTRSLGTPGTTSGRPVSFESPEPLQGGFWVPGLGCSRSGFSESVSFSGSPPRRSHKLSTEP